MQIYVPLEEVVSSSLHVVYWLNAMLFFLPSLSLDSFVINDVTTFRHVIIIFIFLFVRTYVQMYVPLEEVVSVLQHDLAVPILNSDQKVSTDSIVRCFHDCFSFV